MKAVRILAIVLLLALLLVLVPSERARGETVIIPIDEKNLPAPDAKYYTSENDYEDPSISVHVEYGRAYETDYVAAYVKLANASQLRSAMESYDGYDTALGTRIAKHSGAVLAVNGDFFRTHVPGEGRYVVRQGKTLARNARGYFDVLIVDDKGDFHIIQSATKDQVEAFPGTIVNCWSFGPALVIDGEPVRGIVNRDIGSAKAAQRLAICQTGELEYMCVASAGPDNPGSTGMVLDDFITLLTSLGDVQSAYNLDGGTSCTVVFQGQKLNSFGSGKSRQISDMIIFVSAWRE